MMMNGSIMNGSIMNSIIMNSSIIKQIGNWGPFILFILSFYLLYKTPFFLYLYIIGFILNTFITGLLKIIIRQPRPNKKISTFGMPSGHAQSVFFSAMFILLTLKITPYIAFIFISFIYLFIVLITSYQRIKYKYHTISQVIIGSLIGISLGTIWYNIILHIK